MDSKMENTVSFRPAYEFCEMFNKERASRWDKGDTGSGKLCILSQETDPEEALCG